MSRVLLSLTLLLLAVAAQVTAQADAADAKPEHAEDAKPALTALQLPSESLFRAARTAVRAARALADNMPSSLNLSHNMVQTLAVAGAVVVGLVGAAAILALVLPMFGFRLCYLFGTCDTYAHAYLAPTAYDAYAYSQPVYANAAYAKSYDGASNDLAYSYEGYPQHTGQVASYPTTNSIAANAYQKRSLDYVGPILKMLSNAYEKYNHPAATKSVVDPKPVASGSPADAKVE